MKNWSLIAALCASLLGLPGCGDSDEGCPGVTCTNCGGFGDCDANCSSDQLEVCIAHPNDSSLRCAYCQ